MSVNYMIVSVPKYIIFDCPHCHAERLEVEFDERFWYSGQLIDCPECGEEIELGDYEYD